VVAVVAPLAVVILSSIIDDDDDAVGITELKPSKDAVAKNTNEVMPARLRLTL
jgi:hypothetical protein